MHRQCAVTDAGSCYLQLYILTATHSFRGKTCESLNDNWRYLNTKDMFILTASSSGASAIGKVSSLPAKQFTVKYTKRHHSINDKN